jgi:hypothetical protein
MKSVFNRTIMPSTFFQLKLPKANSLQMRMLSNVLRSREKLHSSHLIDVE